MEDIYDLAGGDWSGDIQVSENENENENENEGENEELSSQTAVYMLSSFWMNEKNTPEILEYEIDIVRKVQEIIKLQEEHIYDKMDELNSNNNNDDDDDDGLSLNTSNNNNNNSKFGQYCLNLYKQELERVEYMLNSYFRIRLWKIQEQCIYILSKNSMKSRLSKEELIFCQNYYQLTLSHYKKTFLSQLPKKNQKITEPCMIVKPNVNKHIIMRVNQTIGNFVYDENKDVDLQQGLLFIGKYKDFKSLLYDGTLDAV